MIDVLCMPGTFNPNGEGVTQTFIDRLDRKKFNPRIVPYPADYGRKMSYADSVQHGMAALDEACKANPTRPKVVAGYSQGARIAGDYAKRVGLLGGSVQGTRVLAAALIADPNRPRFSSITPGHRGFGIGGERAIRGVRAYHAVAFGDPITDLPDGNRMRDVADLTEFFAAQTPEQLFEWMTKTAAKAARGEFANVALRPWDRDAWRRIGEAAQWARGYLYDGRHGAAYVRDGLCAALADTLNREIRA
jgi:hypothetical protein